MRDQRSGTIIQMSSQGGRTSFPGASAYSASKFALEGWSESLAAEVAPFGIDVMLVEPSRFRTSFNAADVLEFAAVSDTYRGALAAVRTDMAGIDGSQEGDPDKAAEIVVSLVHGGTELPLRLPLGREAVERLSTPTGGTSTRWSVGPTWPRALTSPTPHPRGGRSRLTTMLPTHS